MKHIKLFEAFESQKLTKTLGFIDSESRNKVLNLFKNICSNIDFPFSQLSDEFIEYLPFNKALHKSSQIVDEPCTATSKSEFPDYSIDGEKCTEGKIKRMWGSRMRQVACPHCGGTGIEPKKSELKLLKFWFNSDKKFVTVTGVDGVIRSSGTTTGGFSKRISDYKVGKTLTNQSEVESLNTGDFIWGEFSHGERVCMIFREGNRVYAIQDEADGSSPNSSTWRQYGRYSWALSRNEWQSIKVLVPNKDMSDQKVNPYTWNVCVNTRRYGGPQIENYKDVKEDIKDAHFALVFDLSKFKKQEFKTTRDIQYSREESRKGSKLDPSQTDEEIKKRNIERYVNTLSQRLDITKDIANCNRLITRSLGGKRGTLYVVYSTDIYSRFGNTISQYLRLLKETDDSVKLRLAEGISELAEELFRVGMKKSSSAEKAIKEVKAKLKSNNKDEIYFQIFDKLDEVSSAIYDNLNNYQVDSIEDMEVVSQKISSMRNILKSDRYGLSRLFNYVIDSISGDRPNRAYDYLIDPYYFEPNEVLENLQRVKNLMSKL